MLSPRKEEVASWEIALNGEPHPEISPPPWLAPNSEPLSTPSRLAEPTMGHEQNRVLFGRPADGVRIGPGWPRTGDAALPALA